MRILHINDGVPPLVPGGASRIALEMARELSRRGHDAALLAPVAAGDDLPTDADVDLLPIKRLAQRWAHWRSVHSNARAAEVLARIDAFRPDVIHAHTVAWQCGYRWMFGAAERGIPVVVTLHDVMTVAYGRVMGDETMLWPKDVGRARWDYNPLRNRIIRKALATCAARLCVSDAQRTFLERHGLRSLRTLRNGVDPSFWTPGDQAAARAELGMPQDAPVFLLAGRLGIDKGTSLVARAMPGNARLIVAGSADGSDFASLGERVRMFSNQTPERLRALYAAADAVLVPSVCLDCFPTVCLEAMACARPVVATTFGGAKESVVDGTTGWIVDPRSAAFGERLRWCADHRSELAAFGAAGRAHVERTFTLGGNVDALEEIYASVRPS